jgi:quercetin dioxygenase-like cupin family protein
MLINQKKILFVFPVFLAILIVAALMGFNIHQDHHKPHGKNHVMMVPSEFTWNEAPASLPPGARVAILEGDPSKEGPFMMRLKLPAEYKIPPHFHPAIEHVTVLSGSFYMGPGEKFIAENAKELTPGGIAIMQIGERHFAFTKGEAEIQLHGIGPWGITYVNEEDDPRNSVVRN